MNENDNAVDKKYIPKEYEITVADFNKT